MEKINRFHISKALYGNLEPERPRVEIHENSAEFYAKTLRPLSDMQKRLAAEIARMRS